MSLSQVSLFGIEIHQATLLQAIEHAIDWSATEDEFHYVVTPNLDHILRIVSRSDYAKLYHRASLVLADGWPVVAASRVFNRPLPERVAGSDLIPGLFDEIQVRGLKRTVFLLGAAPGVAERAADAIRRQWANVRVVGCYSPPRGFENDDGENEKILQLIADVTPDLLVVGLGAPKQEAWIHRYRDRIDARVAFAVGATIDFLAGEQQRAPRWMQISGFEWLHRVATNPRRLGVRYLRGGLQLPWLMWHEWRRISASRETHSQL